MEGFVGEGVGVFFNGYCQVQWGFVVVEYVVKNVL